MNISKMREHAFKLVYELEIQKEFSEESIDIFIANNEIDDKNAKVSVKDSGVGINPAETKELFKSFYQKGQGGRLGLGLSIARDIVLNHDGNIWAESEGEGFGSTFIFTLPISNQE